MWWPLPVSWVLAAVVARLVARVVPRARGAVLGIALALSAIVLATVTPTGVIDLPIGVVLGLGVGLVVPRTDRIGAMVTAGVALVLLVVAGLFGPLATARVAAVAVAAAGVVNIALHWRNRARLGRRNIAVMASGTALAVGLLAWVAGNDPTVQWFGHVVTHGDRNDRRVALTFDDGPDDPFTLQVSAILDAHGVKGTFFEVGKALDARPAIAQALYDDGHLLGNHSYHHDYWRWLDPRYPELDRTEDAFRRRLGICPAFFRPPHGQRTPFMLAHASSKGMHAVTWDVSAQDWSSHDGALVARRIVDGARPGSIILLHDGLDGTVTADRSVLIAALPMILDGLRAKGLEPVRLDELLGVAGYLPHCE